jgi:phosphoribosylformylglycinamidine (FGAM) synthase PurS component
MGTNKQRSISGMNYFYSEATVQGIAALQMLINTVIQLYISTCVRMHCCMGINKQRSISGMNYFYSEATVQRIAALRMLINTVIQLYRYMGINKQRNNNLNI